MKITQSQYKHLADKLMDSGNIFLASLVVGQFLEKTVRQELVVIGIVFYASLVIITTRFREKGGD